MNRAKYFGWAVALFLLFAAVGQAQKLGTAGPGFRPVEPESPGSRSTVAAGSQAVVPRLMKFSGVLHDAAGKPLSGTVDVTFTLYSTEAGGNALWFETQSVQADELGRYTALLGAMHTEGLPVDLFTSGEVRWLGIQVGVEAEQQPRVLLVSVPYALKAGDAETLGGKPASAFMLSDSQNGTASATARTSSTSATAQTSTSGKDPKTRTANTAVLTPCANLASDGTALVNSIAFFDTSCSIQSSGITQLNGNLGIGITTPAARLHVFGVDSQDGDARFNIISADKTAATAGVGGGILFGGYYNGISSRAGFANIRGVKENSIQGDFASAMVFDTRVNGGKLSEGMRITSKGNVIATGILVAANFRSFGWGGTASGVGALLKDTSGYGNTANGSWALESNTTGNDNTASGAHALQFNENGSYDSAFGNCALRVTGTGLYSNLCDLPTLTAGSGDTALGNFAGQSNSVGIGNTFLGYNSDASSGSLTNATAVGAYAVVGASNALVLGSINGVHGATASVNVGIGTTTPKEPLHVASGDAYISNVGSGIILKSPDGLTCKRVSIDNSGALVLTSLTCP